MARAPLAVWLGVKAPQLEPLAPHVTTQSTPALAGSLVTAAATLTLLPAIMEAGGPCVSATEMRGVWVGGVLWLAVLHPAMTPTVAKLPKTARNAPIQSFRRAFRSVLT